MKKALKEKDFLFKKKKRLFYLFILFICVFLWLVYDLLLSEKSFVKFELFKRFTSQEKVVLKVADQPFEKKKNQDFLLVSSSSSSSNCQLNSNSKNCKSLQLRNYPHELVPGFILNGYELKERTGRLGVCEQQLVPYTMQMISSTTSTTTTSSSSSTSSTSSSTKSLQKYSPHVEMNEIPPSCPLFGLLRPMIQKPSQEIKYLAENEQLKLIQDGEKDLLQENPSSLEFQCLFEEEESEVIYINENYRLRRKFDGGSHGEVWRATRQNGQQQQQVFILKRMFVVSRMLQYIYVCSFFIKCIGIG
jgi:hypothetical protein